MCDPLNSFDYLGASTRGRSSGVGDLNSPAGGDPDSAPHPEDGTTTGRSLEQLYDIVSSMAEQIQSLKDNFAHPPPPPAAAPITSFGQQ